MVSVILTVAKTDRVALTAIVEITVARIVRAVLTVSVEMIIAVMMLVRMVLQEDLYLTRIKKK